MPAAGEVGVRMVKLRPLSVAPALRELREDPHENSSGGLLSSYSAPPTPHSQGSGQSGNEEAPSEATSISGQASW